MGRGLSPLQRSILDKAAEGRKRRLARLPAGQDTVDVYSAELVVELFGIRPKGGQLYRCDDGTIVLSRHFTPVEIASRRYRSAINSLARAMRRLERRGLVRVCQGAHAHWTGILLLDPRAGESPGRSLVESPALAGRGAQERRRLAS